MSQFDESTPDKAKILTGSVRRNSFAIGRNSAKDSLAIAEKALRDILEIERLTRTDTRKSVLEEDCEEALASIKARGDSTLEETK